MKQDTRCEMVDAKPETSCHATSQLQEVQPFPSSGPLADNLGVPLPVLKSEVGDLEPRAYSYVLSSVKLARESITFEQRGSAPNFQGGMLTLCTCKHQMRATQSADDWKGVWLAGFTSRNLYDGRHWLFYLAKIASAEDSHCNLWKAVKARTRNAKVADRHFLGDLFRPKSPLPTGNARFNPGRYVTPAVHTHRKHNADTGWRNDIKYRHAGKYRDPPLLVADPRLTFMWDEPLIFFESKHCRNFHKWSSLSDLVLKLRGAR